MLITLPHQSSPSLSRWVDIRPTSFLCGHTGEGDREISSSTEDLQQYAHTYITPTLGDPIATEVAVVARLSSLLTALYCAREPQFKM